MSSNTQKSCPHCGNNIKVSIVYDVGIGEFKFELPEPPIKVTLHDTIEIEGQRHKVEKIGPITNYGSQFEVFTLKRLDQ